RLVAGHSADAFRKIKDAALAHPMAEHVKAETRVAQIHQMGARIRQRDYPGRVLQQWRHALVDGVEEAADKAGLEILLEPEIEKDVERVASALLRYVRDVPVHQPGILRRGRGRDDDAVPVSLEYGSRLWLAQILPEPLAKGVVA